jgi:hypothetical protein
MTDEVVLILKVNCLDVFEIEDSLALLYLIHIVSYAPLAVSHKSRLTVGAPQR